MNKPKKSKKSFKNIRISLNRQMLRKKLMMNKFISKSKKQIFRNKI